MLASSGVPRGGSSMSTTQDVSGLSVPAGSVLLRVSPPPQWPITRLQQGIRKPKVYIDGIVRYGQLAIRSEGPPTLQLH